MKKTRIIAAVLAAIMLAGCGKIEDEVTPTAADAPETELSAETPVSDSSEASSESSSLSSEGNESSEAESGEKKETEKEPGSDGSAGYFGTYINDKNSIITIGSDEDFYKDLIADKQLLYYSAERVIDQYNCIASRDKQGFFDSIDYSGLYKAENAPMFWAQGFLKENCEPTLTEEDIYWETLNYTFDLLGDELSAVQQKFPEDGDIHETGYTRDEVLAEFRGLMDKAAEEATLENSEAFIDENSCFNSLIRKPGSVTDEEYFSSPEKYKLEPSGGQTYIIDMDYGCVKHDSGGAGIYVKMSVTVLDGDCAYDFDECQLWLTKDGDHVMPFPVAVYDNPYKGKTLEEIAASRNEEIRRSESGEKTPCEAALEGAWFHFNEGVYEGEGNSLTWQKLLDYGTYAESVSEKGLAITPDLSEREKELGIGDTEILSSMLEYGYDSGTVWIRPEPDGSGDIYIIYESADGQKEEYHTGHSAWF